MEAQLGVALLEVHLDGLAQLDEIALLEVFLDELDELALQEGVAQLDEGPVHVDEAALLVELLEDEARAEEEPPGTASA